MTSPIRTQFNVINALTIREMQGQMKSSKYGYVWLFIEPLIYIFIFRMARKALGGAGTTAGMTPLMFYVLGILPLYLCLECMQLYSKVSAPSKLFMLSRVTAVDLAVARGVSSFVVYYFLFWIGSVPVSIYEGAWPPENIVKINLTLVASWLLGMGLGFTLSGLYRVFPPIGTVIGYSKFGLRMISGFFFCIVQVPVQYWPYLTWNPLLHITELVRDGWFESYTSPIASPAFVAECILGLAVLGLSAERFLRRVSPA